MYVTNKYDISSHKAKCVCHVACCKLGTHDGTLLVMGALCLHWRMDLCHIHAKHPSLQSKKPLLCKVHALYGCTMIVHTEHASAMLQKALMLLVRAGSIWYSMHAI